MVSPAAGLTAIKTIPTIELILIVGMVLYIDNEFYVIQILESFYVEIIIFPVIFDGQTPMLLLFFSSKASMFQNLSQIREELGTLSFPDVSKQALSKARQFINPSMFKELYYLSVDLFYSQIPSRKLWQGYHLFAVALPLP